MSRELEPIPLFPLQAVLFPYAPLHLHVSEERHRALVQYCLEFDRPIGIVLVRDGDEYGDEPYMVGTAARIETVQTFEDGRMDVMVVGERRFRIRRMDESASYLVGHCEPVVENAPEDTPRADALLMRAREAFHAYVQAVFASQAVTIRINFPTDPVALSFLIANYLPMENLERQRLLELTDTNERLAGLIPAIEHQLLETRPGGYHRLTAVEMQEWIHPN